jgi:hypothetical protein
MKKLFVCVLCSALLGACSTEVELNAPYKSTTVVFGLLDAQADTQWIKINRTFVGEGNNLLYAQIRDSSEYKWEEFNRIVVQKIVNEDVDAEYELSAIEVSNKNVNGIFYAPEQTLYYFKTPGGGLDEDAIYRLVIDFVDRPDVSAETDLVRASEMRFVQPAQGVAGGLPAGTVGMVSSASEDDINFNDEALLKWVKPAGAEAFFATMNFNFTEIRTDGTLVPKQVTFNLGSPSDENVTEGANVDLRFNGEAFFAFLPTVIPTSPEVVRRQIGISVDNITRCFDIEISAANSSLKRYLDANAPVTGLIQERPTLSNISGGLGLFASRAVIRLNSIPVISSSATGNPNRGNLIALVNSTYTSQLGFCDPTPTSEFACP